MVANFTPNSNVISHDRFRQHAHRSHEDDQNALPAIVAAELLKMNQAIEQIERRLDDIQPLIAPLTNNYWVLDDFGNSLQNMERRVHHLEVSRAETLRAARSLSR
ncbi:hypothetical protein IQ266_15310 [filamentous cyanobacterium LEGE 11480]|uniref:Uncharacterized protein n=1 Tax=Romeriopsis navalis LEGE 11480 TaxID=2777977 RepID=A0A928VRA4_9CYAN|nr:hypothetical protein [Romeriopsis navalis]MBE9031102.1 hypothetical protein [Romeriopsis navalis LEGE 11480]